MKGEAVQAVSEAVHRGGRGRQWVQEWARDRSRSNDADDDRRAQAATSADAKRAPRDPNPPTL